MNRFNYNHVLQYLHNTNSKIERLESLNNIKVTWVNSWSNLFIPLIHTPECLLKNKHLPLHMFPEDITGQFLEYSSTIWLFYKKNSKLISAYLAMIYLNEQPSLYEKEYHTYLPSRKEKKLMEIFTTFAVQKEKDICQRMIIPSEYWIFSNIDQENPVYIPDPRINYVDICIFFIRRTHCTPEKEKEYIHYLYLQTIDHLKQISDMQTECVSYIEQTLKQTPEHPIEHPPENLLEHSLECKEEEMDEDTRLCIERLMLEDTQSSVHYNYVEEEEEEKKEQVTRRLMDDEPVVHNNTTYEDTRMELETYTVVKLKEMCKEYGIKPIPKVKNDCITKILERILN